MFIEVEFKDGRVYCPYCKFKSKSGWGVRLHCQRVHADKPVPDMTGKTDMTQTGKVQVRAVKGTELRSVTDKTKAKKPEPKVVKVEHEPGGDQLVLNYCPCCGTNIGVVNKAMIIAQSLEGGGDA